jgi:hypothetical protein
MQNAAGRQSPPRTVPDPLARGRFTDGSREFAVCASSAVAPDSFQVHTVENRADIVLIVSGLTTGDLHATWGDEWRTRSADWRDWARNCAFHVFHNGSLMAEHSRTQGTERHCDG